MSLTAKLHCLGPDHYMILPAPGGVKAMGDQVRAAVRNRPALVGRRYITATARMIEGDRLVDHIKITRKS